LAALAALAGAAVVLAALLTLLAGLLLEQGQPLHQLEDIWWNDDNKNDNEEAKILRKRKKCSGAFLCGCYNVLSISNKFCDLSFLHWVVGGGGSTVRKLYCTVLPHSPPKPSYRPRKLMYIKLPMDL
jgi:hypothetical protein